MSFKSKRQTKHGQLLDNDPLGITDAPAAAVPFFKPTRQHLPVHQGHCATMNGPSSLTNTSIPLPVTRNRNDQHKQAQSSLFASVDISKLRGFSRKEAFLCTTSPLVDSDKEDGDDVLFAQKTERRPLPLPPRPQANNASPVLPPKEGQTAFTKTSNMTSATIPVHNQANVSGQLSSLEHRYTKAQPSLPRQPPPPVPPRQSTKTIPPVQPPPIPSRPRPTLTKSGHIEPPFTAGNKPAPIVQQIQLPDNRQDESCQDEIEDEATLAFAADIKFRMSTYQPDANDTQQLVSFTSGTLNFQGRSTMSASASTSAHFDLSNHQGRPNTASLMVDGITEDELNPWSTMALMDHPQALLSGASSPSLVRPSNRVQNAAVSGTPAASQTDMEPAKQAVFGDLIATWNGQQAPVNSINDVDDDEFGTHVAAGQRDVGFAGIRDTESDERQQSPNTHQALDWHVPEDQDNPWQDHSCSTASGAIVP